MVAEKIRQRIAHAQKVIEIELGCTCDIEITNIQVIDTPRDVCYMTYLNQMCERWGVEFEDVKKTRNHHKVAMRDIMAYFLKIYTLKKSKEVGEIVGLGDHSSTLSAYQRFHDRLHQKDPLFMLYYEPVKDMFD